MLYTYLLYTYCETSIHFEVLGRTALVETIMNSIELSLVN